MILKLVSYVGAIFGFIFLTLSIASGLYYISELVEEQTGTSKRILTRAIYTIIATLTLLLIFDSFPFKLTIFSIASHIIYLRNLKTFPFISLTSPNFILSTVCVILNHYFWFKHFNDTEIPPQFRLNPNYVPKRRASFSEVASFFGLCVWFIPFALFVSLSAGDYALPTSTTVNSKKNDDIGSDGQPKLRKRAVGLVRVVINSIRRYIYNIAREMGYEIDPNHNTLLI